MNELVINYEVDSYAIPFGNVKEVLDLLEYGNQVRVMFEMLALTGCRISELDSFRVDQLHKVSDGWVVFWKPGKKQRGVRKERLPDAFVNELRYCREHFRVKGCRMFSFKSCTFRRRFNEFVRPLLSGAWREVKPSGKRGRAPFEYVLQLKGMRKNFQTLLFAKEWQEWHDASFAMEKTCKRMRHHSKHITVNHYIENFERLDINKYVDCNPADLLGVGVQKRLNDFF